MTHHREPEPAPGSPEHSAHRWLSSHHEALVDGLGDVLDVEAGLQEILLHSHHDSAVDALATVVDTEAGLTAILPESARTPQPNTREESRDSNDPAQTNKALPALSACARMTLRDRPDVKTARLALDSLLVDTLEIPSSLQVARYKANALADDLTQSIITDVTEHEMARHHAAEFKNTVFRSNREASALSHALMQILEAGGLAKSLHSALDRARARAEDLTSVLYAVQNLEYAIDVGVDATRSRYVERALAILISVRTTEVCRAIGQALDQPAVSLDRHQLHTLLNDFTTADLNTTDLTDIDLTGVHWTSRSTHWPPAVDVAELKNRSAETSPGSGIWVVRSGTATIRDLTHL